MNRLLKDVGYGWVYLAAAIAIVVVATPPLYEMNRMVSDEGSLLYSGDAGYPTDLANASMMDRVWIDDRPHATRCVVDSAAVVAFDGTITWTTTSERFDPVVTVARARLRSL